MIRSCGFCKKDFNSIMYKGNVKQFFAMFEKHIKKCKRKTKIKLKKGYK